MSAVKYQELRELIRKYDTNRNLDGHVMPDQALELSASLDAYFREREAIRCVLGVDIYRYSDMPRAAQRLVPTLFREIYDVAAGLCAQAEPFLFHDLKFAEQFVSTGDGGFQIAATPLHAIVFAVFFELALVTYNGSYVRPKLRQLVGSLSVRYAITLDLLFEQDGNFFGPAIIRNARILSRDALNRCLLDHLTVEWLQSNLVSVESLLGLTREVLQRLPAFRSHEQKAERSLLFGSKTGEGIKAVNLQKLGIVSAKRTDLDVYSLMVQVAISRQNLENQPEGTIVATLGNLNTAGITE